MEKRVGLSTTCTGASKRRHNVAVATSGPSFCSRISKVKIKIKEHSSALTFQHTDRPVAAGPTERRRLVVLYTMARR